MSNVLLDANVTPEVKEAIRQVFKNGFVYYRLNHNCGYKGNAYYEQDSKWHRRTHCPQCNQELNWVPLEEVMLPLIKEACGPNWKPPEMQFNQQSTEEKP